jgi:hypothetical protein
MRRTGTWLAASVTHTSSQPLMLMFSTGVIEQLLQFAGGQLIQTWPRAERGRTRKTPSALELADLGRMRYADVSGNFQPRRTVGYPFR